METGTDIVELDAGPEGVERLITLAHRDAWSPDELPWELPHPEPSLGEEASLLSALPEFRKMSPRVRGEVRLSELGSHLSALAYGEDRAVTLAGDTVLLCEEDNALSRWFLGTLLSDEAKHFVVLRRYLAQVLAQPVQPHPPLREVFRQLALEKDYALNLLVGQVVLEGAAASLLASLLISTREPLLRELLKRISRDEARHMKFAHLAHVEGEELSPARKRRMEEILFEAAYAALASLIAEPTWWQFELPPARARAATIDALRDRGVLGYYARVVARQLARRGFPASAVGRALESRLEQRLRAGG